MIHADERSRVRSGAIAANALPLAALALGGLAFAYLVFKAATIAAAPGYDFRYIWVAGSAWIHGVSPYGENYGELSSTLISSGHVPEMWFYPPNWWPIASFTALFDLRTSFVVWTALNLAMTLGASVLLVHAFRTAFPGAQIRLPLLGDMMRSWWSAALLHFFIVAVLEATAIAFSVGQTSGFGYFGVALLLYGMSSGRSAFTIAGLVLLFLKPQIALPFAALFCFMSARSRLELILALAVSALLATPALIADPGAIGAFLTNLRAYDGYTDANLPAATTGMRILVWQLISVDWGNAMWAIAAALLTLALCFGPLRIARAEAEPARAWQVVSIATAALLAIAPLHYYDFMLAAVLLFALLSNASWRPMVVGLAGAALIIRADQLGGALGLYDPEVPIFEGSLLATIGAILLGVSVYFAVRQWSRQTDAAS